MTAKGSNLLQSKLVKGDQQGGREEPQQCGSEYEIVNGLTGNSY